MSLQFVQNGKTPLEVASKQALNIESKVGATYNLVDSETGKTVLDAVVHRDGDNLVIASPEHDAKVVLERFWGGECTPSDRCYLVMDAPKADQQDEAAASAPSENAQEQAQTITITQDGPVLEHLLAGDVGTLDDGALLPLIPSDVSGAMAATPLLLAAGLLLGLGGAAAAMAGGHDSPKGATQDEGPSDNDAVKISAIKATAKVISAHVDGVPADGKVVATIGKSTIPLTHHEGDASGVYTAAAPKDEPAYQNQASLTVKVEEAQQQLQSASGTVDLAAPAAPQIAEKEGQMVITPAADAQELNVTVGNQAFTATKEGNHWKLPEGVPEGTKVNDNGVITIPNLAADTHVQANNSDAAGNTSTNADRSTHPDFLTLDKFEKDQKGQHDTSLPKPEITKATLTDIEGQVAGKDVTHVAVFKHTAEGYKSLGIAEVHKGTFDLKYDSEHDWNAGDKVVAVALKDVAKTPSNYGDDHLGLISVDKTVEGQDASKGEDEKVYAYTSFTPDADAGDVVVIAPNGNLIGPHLEKYKSGAEKLQGLQKGAQEVVFIDNNAKQAVSESAQEKGLGFKTRLGDHNGIVKRFAPVIDAVDKDADDNYHVYLHGYPNFSVGITFTPFMKTGFNKPFNETFNDNGISMDIFLNKKDINTLMHGSAQGDFLSGITDENQSQYSDYFRAAIINQGAGGFSAVSNWSLSGHEVLEHLDLKHQDLASVTGAIKLGDQNDFLKIEGGAIGDHKIEGGAGFDNLVLGAGLTISSLKDLHGVSGFESLFIEGAQKTIVLDAEHLISSNQELIEEFLENEQTQTIKSVKSDDLNFEYDPSSYASEGHQTTEIDFRANNLLGITGDINDGSIQDAIDHQIQFAQSRGGHGDFSIAGLAEFSLLHHVLHIGGQAGNHIDLPTSFKELKITDTLGADIFATGTDEFGKRYTYDVNNDHDGSYHLYYDAKQHAAVFIEDSLSVGHAIH